MPGRFFDEELQETDESSDGALRDTMGSRRHRGHPQASSGSSEWPMGRLPASTAPSTKRSNSMTRRTLSTSSGSRTTRWPGLGDDRRTLTRGVHAVRLPVNRECALTPQEDDGTFKASWEGVAKHLAHTIRLLSQPSVVRLVPRMVTF
jgi:hypothetical protein